MGWDGQWDIHAFVERQVDIPWNVPLSHGTVGWDGQFTAFLDIYGGRASGIISTSVSADFTGAFPLEMLCT